jgi:nucleolar protein 15
MRNKRIAPKASSRSKSTTPSTVVVPIVKTKEPVLKQTINEKLLEQSIDNEDMIMMEEDIDDDDDDEVGDVEENESHKERSEKVDDEGDDDDDGEEEVEGDDGSDEGDDEDDDQRASSTSTNKSQKLKQQKTKKIDMVKKNIRNASVIYIGHLPSLFGEYELLTFLKQFGGTITHIRISRSEKTGNSRGYAFIRIIEADIANIIVNTLSGYLLFSQKDVGVHKRFVCHIVPEDKVHPRLFVKRTSAIDMPKLRKQRKLQPVQKALSKLSTMNDKLLQNERKKRMKLQQAGIDYDFPGYETKLTLSKKVSDAKTTSTTASNMAQTQKRTTPSSILPPEQKKQKLVEPIKC